MNPRFFAPDAHAPGECVRLPADESAHLLRVLRLNVGDTIRVFNGRGGEFEAHVQTIDRRVVAVTIRGTARAADEPRVAIAVAQAVLKSDKMDGVVRDAVMMGASAIQPFVAGRSETTLAALDRSNRRERWERIAVASAKQSGRAILPVIRPPCTFEALRAETRADAAATLMFVEPGASEAAQPLHALDGDRPAQATLVLGPEGGWTTQEIAGGGQAWRLVTMRLPTLRADAMPAVAMAAVLATWREL